MDFVFSSQTAQGYKHHSPSGTEHFNSMKLLGQLGRWMPMLDLNTVGEHEKF